MSMTRRIVTALIVAIPFALVSLHYAFDIGGPQILEYIVSPGSYVGFYAPPADNMIDFIGHYAWTALAVNEVYYAILVFLAISLVRLIRHSGGAGSEKSGKGTVPYKNAGS